MKLKETAEKIINEIKARDIIAMVLILIIELYIGYLIQVNITIPLIRNICRIINWIFCDGCIVLIFVAKWYKIKCHRSLFLDLLDTENHGNLIQLIIRAIKYPKPEDKNASSGKSISINSDGIVLGLDKLNQIVVSPSKDEQHISVFGGSGSGKTSSILIPTAKRFDGTKFLIDVSGDITNELSKDKDLNLISPDNNDSVAFDIFYYIDNEEDRSKQMIMLKQLSEIVIPEEVPTIVGDGAFYQRSAHQLFYAALIYLYDTGLDFCDICYQIQKSDPLRLINEIKEHGSPNAKFALNGMGEIRDYILGNIKQNLDSQISLFSTSRKAKRILHRNNSRQRTVSAEILEKEDIILVVPQDEVAFYAPLMKLISGMVILYCSKRPLLSGRKILIALDEFPILGFLNILEPLRTLRKHNTRIMILTQSLSDIEYIYGRVATRIIMDNCGIKIVLNSIDYETNRYLSNIIGMREVRCLTRTYDSADSRYSYSTKLQPSVFPEELGRLKDELIAILPDGYLRLKKAYYWKSF